MGILETDLSISIFSTIPMGQRAEGGRTLGFSSDPCHKIVEIMPPPFSYLLHSKDSVALPGVSGSSNKCLRSVWRYLDEGHYRVIKQLCYLLCLPKWISLAL